MTACPSSQMEENSSEGLEGERFGEGWPLLIYSIGVQHAGASPAFPAFKTPSLETFLQVLVQFNLLVLSLLCFFFYNFRKFHPKVVHPLGPKF